MVSICLRKFTGHSLGFFSFALAFFIIFCRFHSGFFLSPLPFSLLLVNFAQVFSFAPAFCNKLLVIINFFSNNELFVINMLKVYFLCEFLLFMCLNGKTLIWIRTNFFTALQGFLLHFRVEKFSPDLNFPSIEKSAVFYE